MTEKKKPIKLAHQETGKQRHAREARNATVSITVKPRRKVAVAGQPPAPASPTRAEKKQRKRVEEAARLAAAFKIPKKSRVIRTYTDEQAKARWKGQPTRVIIAKAYPGHEPPEIRDVDMMDIAWQGGAPSLGKKK